VVSKFSLLFLNLRNKANKSKRTKCVFSHIINYPDDDNDHKSNLNMLVINNMWQNKFWACAIIGFVT